MISYDLAKKLKDAGYPQTGWLRRDSSTEEMLSYPTLEELIEACGDKFTALLKHDDGSGWTALKTGDVLFTAGGENEDLCIGQTPSEAVAELWLNLAALKSQV